VQIGPFTGNVLADIQQPHRTAAKGGRRNVNFYRPLDGHLVYASGQAPMEDGGYTDDVTVPNPPGLFISIFQAALARHGIKVEGKLRTMNWLDREAEPIALDHLVELGAMESLPMGDIAREVQKPSQNLYTDLLLEHVGEKMRAANSAGDQTSEELGVRELNKFLAEAGVKRGDGVIRGRLGAVAEQPDDAQCHRGPLAVHEPPQGRRVLFQLAAHSGSGWDSAQSDEGHSRRGQCPRQDRNVALGKFTIRPRHDRRGGASHFFHYAEPLS